MLTWTPGKQSLADFIDFEHDGKTYLIGVGQYDGSVWIIKLKSGGSGTKIPLNVLLHGWAGLAVAGVYSWRRVYVANGRVRSQPAGLGP